MLTDHDIKLFDKARKIASISDFAKIHVGCVAVYHGKIIGVGCNTNKTHPVQKYYNQFRDSSETFIPKLHAEINCLNQIKNFNINFSKVRLYIYRIRKDQPYGMSRPCPSCMAAVKDLGIREIYYTSNDGLVCERIEKYVLEVLRNSL